MLVITEYMCRSVFRQTDRPTMSRSIYATAHLSVGDRQTDRSIMIRLTIRLRARLSVCLTQDGVISKNGKSFVMQRTQMVE